MACIDSGSDLTLMQENQFLRIFNKNKKLLRPCQTCNIRTFSDNELKVLGQIECPVAFERGGMPVYLTIIVIQDINDSVPAFLFGNDSFKTCLATLAYTGNKESPLPEFMVHIPFRVSVPVYYSSPHETFSCTANYSLKPFETRDVEFFLHSAAPVLRNNEIIITALEFENVHILPSKTCIEFDVLADRYVAYGCVVNLTNSHLTGSVKGRFEIINKTYSSYLISEQNKNTLLTLMAENPPVREILTQSCDTLIAVNFAQYI